MAFRKLGLSEEILKVIEESKFEKPSEIQEKAIPFVLQGKDIIAGSATGSGKTLAFGAGIIQNVKRGEGIQALVLTPTRELAEQITKEITKFSKHHPMKIACVYGGVGMEPQVEAMETAEVIIATPGRILDHLARGNVSLKGIKILVLDEADRMLDMGFIDDVDKIISQVPKQRQTLLFSATISADIAHIAKKYLSEPIEVSAISYVDASKLEQVYYDVDDKEKFSLLVHLLKNEPAGLIMVFCNTRNTVDFVANNLKANEIHSSAIHGGLSQSRRNTVLDNFKEQSVYVMVCTDVAARGLDIKGVSHVYNYDIPKDSKEYVHRIGRTARAGKEGKAVNIVASRDYENFNKVLQNRDLKITKEETPQFGRASVRWIPERRNFRPGERGNFSRGRSNFRGRTNNFSRR